MGKVIRFLDRVPDDYHDRIIGRAFGRWKNRNHRAQIESKRMRQSEHSHSATQSAISEDHESFSKPQLSLSECRELGIPINDDLVISFRPNGKSS